MLVVGCWLRHQSRVSARLAEKDLEKAAEKTSAAEAELQKATEDADEEAKIKVGCFATIPNRILEGGALPLRAILTRALRVPVHRELVTP